MLQLRCLLFIRRQNIESLIIQVIQIYQDELLTNKCFEIANRCNILCIFIMEMSPIMERYSVNIVYYVRLYLLCLVKRLFTNCIR
jgi:hypothetical protein